MNLLGLYHRLPYPGRCLAAGLRGLYLRRWRYSSDTPLLVAEAQRRERWSEEDWTRFQDEALAVLLERAVRQVPYYREAWRRRPQDDWRRLENWPVLKKEDVRRDPHAFLADDCQPGRMFPEHTSGSTGTPLCLWWSRSTTRRWYALVEARLRAWNSVGRGDPWAILGGRLVAPASARRPPYWVWNRPLDQLYLSSYHLEPGNAAAYVDAMKRHSVRYLMGYPSAMAALARPILDQGLDAPRLRVAISNAEPLFDAQRHAISQAFGCPVRDTYGCAELVCGASECEAGRLHLWPEVGRVEVLRDEADVAVERGETGRLIATGLLNADMPLVRYEVGDRIALATEAEPCSCGRLLPALRTLEGRLDDVITTPEGRRVGRLDPVFKADLPIREAQIVQETRRRVVMRVVPAPEYGAGDAAELVRRLRLRLGTSMEISVEEVERLERGGAGKLRAVISKITGAGPSPTFGSAKGLIKMSDDFDEPLEDFDSYGPREFS